jgi:hypothetical protein
MLTAVKLLPVVIILVGFMALEIQPMEELQ